MAKYYIESGQISYMICASDLEGAALWVMHRVMDQKIDEFEAAEAEAQRHWHEDQLDDVQSLEDPFFEEHLALNIPQAIPYEAMLDGLAEFDEKIKVSEIGFGRSEAGELETESIFHQWRQLMMAVDRLHDEQG
jgi:hypothetical protein